MQKKIKDPVRWAQLSNEHAIEHERQQALAELGRRVLEILRAPQASSSYRTVNRAADAELIELEAQHLGLLPEDK